MQKRIAKQEALFYADMKSEIPIRILLVCATEKEPANTGSKRRYADVN